MPAPARLLRRFSRDAHGATAIEYGLIAALLSLVVIAGATLVGTKVYDLLSSVSARIFGG